MCPLQSLLQDPSSTLHWPPLTYPTLLSKFLLSPFPHRCSPQARAEGGSGGPGSSPSEDDVSPEDMARAQTALNDKLPVFVDAIWKVSALDIQVRFMVIRPT